MSRAQRLPSTSDEPLAWAVICDQHPGEWVCLINVENNVDGAILSAHVFAHDRSMRKVLAETGGQPDIVLVHTSGRPLLSPRLEVTDEIRDIVRPRR